MLFRLAVESAKQNNIMGAVYEIDEDDLNGLNEACCRIVARNNGIVSFEGAYKAQKD